MLVLVFTPLMELIKQAYPLSGRLEYILNGRVECGLIAQEVLETDLSWLDHQQNITEDIQKP